MCNSVIPENGTIRLSDKLWVEARRRAEVIGSIAKQKEVSRSLAEEAAQKLKLSRRTIYNLIRRWRASGGSTASLVSTGSQGGKGKNRLDEQMELLIVEAINGTYLSRQKQSVAAVMMDIKERCHKAKLRPPSINTVRYRIRKLKYEDVLHVREGAEAIRKLQPVESQFPKMHNPLDVIQIDHTPVDIIIVDSYHRQPIGRPWVTFSIDIYTRCIVGFCLTLEPPSATSVGLCLAHIVSNKQEWLEHIGVDVQWPMAGKPKIIHVDNGTEFHSEALKRGCEVHGIQINYRPVAQPHYGGTVERVIGTMMKMVHSIPGTTFSNIAQRGKYDSEKSAVLTLSELEKWLTLAIASYHESLHSSIGEPPIVRWNRAVTSGWTPFYVRNNKAFLIDFLPIFHRHIQRQGFVLDHIVYMSSSLRPWISDKTQGTRFIIRRDPRNLSCIYVLPPEADSYIEVPYRAIEAPAITLCEHKAAVKRLKEDGRKSVNEEEIFKIIGKMRLITEDAVKTSKAARRKIARAEHLTAVKRPRSKLSPPVLPEAEQLAHPRVIKLFDIEEW